MNFEVETAASADLLLTLDEMSRPSQALSLTFEGPSTSAHLLVTPDEVSGPLQVSLAVEGPSTCECIVANLLKKSFQSRTYEEKKKIISDGRCTPFMALKTKTKVCVRHFKSDVYTKHKWLTGCEKMGKLFCWPCLLFVSDKGAWNSHGYCDLNNLYQATQRHERSQIHFGSWTKLKSFGLSRIDLQLDQQLRFNVIKHNETVKSNRQLMCRLISVVCTLGKQELAFRGHTESENSYNRGNYVEILNLLSEFDDKLANHLKIATVFSGLSNHIQNDIIEAIHEVMLIEIKSELQDAPFVAILLDETTDISCKSQLSTVLRYISKAGKIEERFLGFTDVGGQRSAKDLCEIVFKCIDEYKCAEKLIAQTYDGASVMSGEISGLQTRVRAKYPNAMFIHCWAHKLNLVLSQGVSKIKECNVFFLTLSGLSSYFSTSSKRTHALDEHVKKRFPKVAPTRWNYNSRLVFTVNEQKSALKDLFQNIIDNPSKWESDSYNPAYGYLKFLNDFEFNFLLCVFCEIFSFTDTLFNVLQKKSFDIGYCLQKLSETKNLLSKTRNDFNKFWKQVENEPPPTKRQRLCDDIEASYRRLFFEIIDNILGQLDFRFGNLDKLKFLEVMDVQKRGDYRRTFPEAAFISLKESYGNHFDFPLLRCELIAAINLP